MLTLITHDEHARQIEVDEINERPGCWQAIAEQYLALTAELSFSPADGINELIRYVEGEIADALDKHGAEP